MQSWPTDLPAIQTGMLVVFAVTFHGEGSKARPPPPAPTTTAAAAAAAAVVKQAVSRWDLCFTFRATVIYCDLSQQKKWKPGH